MKLGDELGTKLDSERVRFLYFFFGFSKVGASMLSATGGFFFRGRGLRARLVEARSTADWCMWPNPAGPPPAMGELREDYRRKPRQNCEAWRK